METSKHDVNWTTVRLDYETTAASLRVIGARHRLSHTAVAKRARLEGWRRGAVVNESLTDAPKPANRSPREILQEIAESKLCPAAARVSACRELILLDKQSDENKKAEQHDRITTRALELIQGGRQ